MSTPTQRPTPETDAMFMAFNRREPNAIDPADFARKLECERNEAREQLEAMREAFMAAKAFIDCHVADPDITAEMIKAYTAYQESFRKLQPFLKQ